MGDKKINIELDQYQKRVAKKLRDLTPVFARAAIGDFSLDVNIPENEDEFSQLHVGVQIMLEVIRDKLYELEQWNEALSRKVAEKTKAFEEAQYLTHLGSWEWDVATNTVSWSDEMYRIYGMEPQGKSLDYETFLNYVHPDDRERVRAIIKKAYSTCKPYNFFHKIVRDDGVVRILQGRGKVEAGKNGKAIRMVGTGQDVTELKHAEQELIEAKRRLEEKVRERTDELQRTLEELRKEMLSRETAQAKAQELAAIAESTQDAIIGKNLRGTITSWNKAAQKMYGYTAREATGKNISLIIPDDKRGEVRRIMQKLREGKHIKHFETVRKHKSGRLVYVSLTISPIKDRKGRVIGASSIARDITRQVSAQKERKASQARLDNFMNSAKDVFAIYDSDLRLVDINKAGLKLMGQRSKKNLIGQRLSDLYPSLKRSTRYKIYEEVLKNGRSKTTEERISHPVFGEKYLMVDIFRLDAGIGVIGRDITEQKRSREALNESEGK